MTWAGATTRIPQKLQFALGWKADECLLWPHGRFKAGYGAVWDGEKNAYCHVIICAHFNGPKPTPEHEAAHACGRGHDGCIAPRHLSWKTPKENCADRYAHGTASSPEKSQKGKSNAAAKLTPNEVQAIRNSSWASETLAPWFGISGGQIRRIRRGEAWK